MDIASEKIRELENQWKELNSKKEDELKSIGKDNINLYNMIDKGYTGKMNNILQEILIIEESCTKENN